jgi:GTPase SAR1 family protein
MKNIYFVVGLENGGKTSTIKSLLKMFDKKRTGSNIKINNIIYQVRDYSNCDIGRNRFKKRGEKYMKRNLIYPLCLDIKNNPPFEEIVEFLKKLEKNHKIYLFIIENGKNNRSIKENYVESLRAKFNKRLVSIKNSRADNSNQLLDFIKNT